MDSAASPTESALRSELPPLEMPPPVLPLGCSARSCEELGGGTTDMADVEMGGAEDAEARRARAAALLASERVRCSAVRTLPLLRPTRAEVVAAEMVLGVLAMGAEASPGSGANEAGL